LPPDVGRLTPRRFASDVRDVLANHSYRNLVGGALFAAVAGGFGDVVGLYVNTYYWEFSTSQIAAIVWRSSPAVLVGMLAARPLSQRFDKKGAALGIAIFAVAIGPLPIFLRQLDWLPANGDPLLLHLITVHSLLSVACVVAIGIIVSSMLADVVDEGELTTGRRQEGMFTATISFAVKGTSGLGGLVAGIALDAIAFPRGADPGAVPADKVAALGFAVGPGLVLLYLVMLAFLARYRITRERHAEILRELEGRRATTAAPG
jgi:Na+/melibiose symporter-like transporter